MSILRPDFSLGRLFQRGCSAPETPALIPDQAITVLPEMVPLPEGPIPLTQVMRDRNTKEFILVGYDPTADQRREIYFRGDASVRIREARGASFPYFDGIKVVVSPTYKILLYPPLPED